jgi:hypothetical protein
MSNKLEAATGGTNTFTDSEGEVFHAETSMDWDGTDLITLAVFTPDDEDAKEVVFFKADAARIIALIAEAAK